MMRPLSALLLAIAVATPLPAALADPAATTVTATIHRGAIHG